MITATRASGPAERPRSGLPTPAAPRGSRRTLVALASAGLVCLSVAAFVSLYASARHTTPVLVAARTIPQGQVVAAADLRAADVAVPGGVGVVPAAGAQAVVGRRSVVTVPVGALLSPSDLATGPGLPSGQAVVGVALKDGEFPPAGVAPGRQVMVVETNGTAGVPSVPAPSAVAASGGDLAATVPGMQPVVTLVPTATVTTTAAPQGTSGGSTLLVGLAVPLAAAGPVAVAAAAGQVSLVLLPAGAAPSAPASGGSGGPA
jgi:hypothetical protein